MVRLCSPQVACLSLVSNLTLRSKSCSEHQEGVEEC